MSDVVTLEQIKGPEPDVRTEIRLNPVLLPATPSPPSSQAQDVLDCKHPAPGDELPPDHVPVLRRGLVVLDELAGTNRVRRPRARARCRLSAKLPAFLRVHPYVAWLSHVMSCGPAGNGISTDLLAAPPVLTLLCCIQTPPASLDETAGIRTSSIADYEKSLDMELARPTYLPCTAPKASCTLPVLLPAPPVI